MFTASQANLPYQPAFRLVSKDALVLMMAYRVTPSQTLRTCERSIPSVLAGELRKPVAPIPCIWETIG
jgi:hypothetical protein